MQCGTMISITRRWWRSLGETRRTTRIIGARPRSLCPYKYGLLYQGQWYRWQKQPRGTPALQMHPEQLVLFIQNHDQIANSGLGQRVNELAGTPRCRAMTAFMLLAPGTPMLFMGQEFAASSLFLYFADHDAELAELVHKGRQEFLAQFRSLASPEVQDALPRPDDPSTFERCKLDFLNGSRMPVPTVHRDLLGGYVARIRSLLRAGRAASTAPCSDQAPS